MKCLIGFALTLIAVVSGGPTQCIRATGHLRCPINPSRANEVYVELSDKDEPPDEDDVMEVGFTSANGNFHLYGCAQDPVGEIDPVLTIVHRCKPGEGPAKKTKGATAAPGIGWAQKLTIPIQSTFIGNVWNVTINLENPPNYARAEPFNKNVKSVCDLRVRRV